MKEIKFCVELKKFVLALQHLRCVAINALFQFNAALPTKRPPIAGAD
jgi:hypothetical protein